MAEGDQSSVSRQRRGIWNGTASVPTAAGVKGPNDGSHCYWNRKDALPTVRIRVAACGLSYFKNLQRLEIVGGEIDLLSEHHGKSGFQFINDVLLAAHGEVLCHMSMCVSRTHKRGAQGCIGEGGGGGQPGRPAYAQPLSP